MKIFLKDDIIMTEQKDLENKIKSISGVTNVSYESKNEAINKFKEQLGAQNKSLIDGLEKDNPMPSSYIVKVEKPDIISNVVNNIKHINGIENIKDGREVIDKLMSITKTIKWIGTTLFILLISVSLLLIGNTIKLAVYSRKKEISIMKYIGASDWFIRWPFIIEGIIIGVIGAVISNLLLYYIYNIIYTKSISGLVVIQFLRPQYVLTNIFPLFLIIGTFVGTLGSVISIRKFLKV